VTPRAETPHERAGGSDRTTLGIRVQVRSAYVAERSEPSQGRYFFAYKVRITNVGTETAQLVSRRWVITDADGDVETVEGPGVVGEQPTLAPGESFEYTSFCPLATSFGSMHGSYRMVRPSGEGFEVEIAPFHLAMPAALN
jgi:ApaG protein